MINENLEEFMKNIEIKTKEVSEYRNEVKGIKYMLNTAQLLTRVDKLELTEKELEIAKFKGQVEKKEYELFDTTRIVPKNTITGNKRDQYTLVDDNIKATKIFNVSNQVGINKAFDNQEEAFKYSDKVNEEVMKYIGA